MPPKLKASKSDWQQCIACKVILASKDVDQHENCCPGDFAADFDPGLTHDYIQGCALHGTLRELSNKNDDFGGLPSSAKSRLVFLNPSCMKMCGIAIKDLVALTSKENDVSLYLAWPSRNIGLTSVCLAKGKCPTGKRTIVRKYRKAVTGARSLSVVPAQEVRRESMPELQKSILLQNDRFVRVGSNLRCRFYGRELDFRVVEIRSERTSSRSNEVDVEIVQKQMGSLSLNQSISETSEAEASSDRPPTDASTPIRVPRRIPSTFKTPAKSPEGTDEEDDDLPDFYRIESWTTVTIDVEESEGERGPSFDDVGGLDDEIRALRELIETPLEYPDAFARLGLKPLRGALLYGPPGTGKTMIARAVAAEVGAHFVTINGPEVFSKFYGETEATLRNIFKAAAENAPSIVFVDEIDALCPKRETGVSDQEARVVSTMVTLIDTLPAGGDKWVLVLAATNKPNSLDPSIRQPGRLDREIEIGVPPAAARHDILRKILRRVRHSLTREEISEIAETAHGLTGADLSAVCGEAALRAMRRHLRDGGSSGCSDCELSREVSVSLEDFAAALKLVKPSAMREVMLEIPKIRWRDIGGMAEVKLKLKQAVEWPLRHREAFERLGVRPPHGVLLYGPPGCSKTMIAKALATESGLNFIAIKGPELFSKWVGDSERAVREVFRKARTASPCIVFFDEIDALAAQRGSTKSSSNVGDRVIAQLLSEIDGIERLEDVVLVAATNRPDMVDEAMLRPGRLDSIVYVPLPDAETRREILHINLEKRPVDKDVDVENLVERTEGYSGAEVVAVCQEAAMKALEEDIGAVVIKRCHFEAALKVVKPRISKETVQFYETYGSSGRGVQKC